jgi:AhpD family alkylhydroperoxidase
MSAKRNPIEYKDASPQVRAVYDDIMATRKTDWVNNFWKVLAHDPASLRRIWTNIKEVMGPGTIDPLVKEMLYVAVSASNGCRYCIASHGAAARNKGMTEAQYSQAAGDRRPGKRNQPAGYGIGCAGRRAVSVDNCDEGPQTVGPLVAL